MTPVKIRARQSVGALLFRTAGVMPSPGTLTILMYHAVTSTPVDDDGQMSVSVDRFERQLSEIADAGVRVTDLVEGASALSRGSAPSDPAVAIVFDDGFVGVHDLAAPALQRRGFPATVFVTTSWIGRPEMPLADPRLGRPMTWREVGALEHAGIAVGNHTETHQPMSRLDADAMRQEVARARDTIADRIGRSPDAFAYPFGAYDSFDDRSREALAAEGVQVACTTVFGRNGADADPLALRRIRVSWCDRDGEILKALSGCYDWYRWVQRAQTMMSPRAAA
jgi:peptidoglycan/xylan/chitin deacetylase (PgdA/CDA1 family)